ncbi:MAG: hypothetical protein N3D84_02130 [Candidatus Woesearchaeota archaeon]|nr:hypothetical protein [Candidatus Woesearchaeota archaeon]
MAKEAIFYMKIENPVDLRRALLESLRDVLRALQKFEDLKKIRAEKAKEIAVLNNCMKEINLMIGKVKSHLPPVPVKIQLKEIKPKKKEERAIKQEKEEKKEEAVESLEVAELERQLKEIEKKLERLG